jgi:hypothetical protein
MAWRRRHSRHIFAGPHGDSPIAAFIWANTLLPRVANRAVAMQQRYRVIHDVSADWRRWTPLERCLGLVLALLLVAGPPLAWLIDATSR